MFHILIAYYIGAKIGNELFRYHYPEAKYPPPPWWDWRINADIPEYIIPDRALDADISDVVSSAQGR